MKRKSKKKPGQVSRSKETSLSESQGITSFSGSANNAPGSVDHGKVISNKKRR